MFTGIVEVLGTVTTLEALDSSKSGGGGTSLTVSVDDFFLKDAHLGDSICVNGTCLTITELPSSTSFKLGIAPETIRRTNLGLLKQHSQLNLERALLPETRLGGHFLQGHVDTTARIAEKRADGNAVTFRFEPKAQEVLRYIVEKGFIAIDGASLTVTAVDDGGPGKNGWFEVMLIAYTQQKVVTAKKEVGDEINLEVDMVGKYVEKSVAGYFEGSEKATGSTAVLEKMVSRIVDEKLKGR